MYEWNTKNNWLKGFSYYLGVVKHKVWSKIGSIIPNLYFSIFVRSYMKRKSLVLNTLKMKVQYYQWPSIQIHSSKSIPSLHGLWYYRVSKFFYCWPFRYFPASPYSYSILILQKTSQIDLIQLLFWHWLKNGHCILEKEVDLLNRK